MLCAAVIFAACRKVRGKAQPHQDVGEANAVKKPVREEMAGRNAQRESDRDQGERLERVQVAAVDHNEVPPLCAPPAQRVSSAESWSLTAPSSRLHSGSVLFCAPQGAAEIGHAVGRQSHQCAASGFTQDFRTCSGEPAGLGGCDQAGGHQAMGEAHTVDPG